MSSQHLWQTLAQAVSALFVMLAVMHPALAAPPESPTSTTPSSSRYQQALTECARGNFGPGVTQYYKAILLDDPLLSLECRKRDLREAWNFFAALQKQGRANPKIPFHLSLIRRSCLEIDLAEKLLIPIREKHPGSPLLKFVHGELFLAREAFADAERLFLELAENPKGAKLARLARHLQQRAGQNPDPELKRRQALKTAYRHLDLLELDQAETAFRGILLQYPDDLEVIRGLINTLLERGAEGEALKILDDTRNRLHQSPLGASLEARLIFQAGRFMEVDMLLTPVLEQSPNDAYARHLRAEARFQMGDLKGAARDFQLLVEADRKNPDLVLRLAACLERTGRLEAAREAFQEALQNCAQVETLRFEYAGLLFRLNDLDGAMNWFREISLTPGAFQEAATERLREVRQAMLNQAIETVNSNRPTVAPPPSEPVTTPGKQPEIILPIPPTVAPRKIKPVKPASVDLKAKLGELYQ